MNLTEYLLTCLGEEGAEIAQDCSKANRFGLDDVNILLPEGPTNRARLIAELNDLMAVTTILVMHGILPPEWQDADAQEAKMQKVMAFANYSRNRGNLAE